MNSFLQALAPKVRGKKVGLPDTQDDRLPVVIHQLESQWGVKCYVPSEEELRSQAGAVEDCLQEMKAKRGKVPSKIPEALLMDSFYHCGALLNLGSLDAVVGGLSVPTAHVIRSALATVGLAPQVKLVSSVFLMVLKETLEGGQNLVLFTDGAVNPAPSSAELVDIAFLGATAFSRWTGILPRVGFLSFSTKGSADHPAVSQTREAAKLFASVHPEILSDGEMQFDAAVSPSVAARKALGSATAGQVNVAVFPDLNAANIGYKIAERIGGAEALGPVLLGTALPISDLSRGATPESVISSVILTLGLGS